MSNLQDKIREDEQYIKFMRVITMNAKRINVETLIDEVKEITEMRTRTSVAYDKSPRKMLTAIVQENLKAQSYRSRLSEISLQSTRVVAQINNASAKMRDYINLTFNEEIKKLGRSKDDRAVISNVMLSKSIKYVDSLEALIEMAGIVISDIDKQHYSLKLAKETVELLIQRESILS